MSEPYLILHKVRGEPAFDIAIKWAVGGPEVEEWWIIPTSGHRAYPYWYMSLQEATKLVQLPLSAIPPTDWPDHYSCNDRTSREPVYEVETKARALLEGLGLVKKVTVERRD